MGVGKLLRLEVGVRPLPSTSLYLWGRADAHGLSGGPGMRWSF